jgi:hypothetical protein
MFTLILPAHALREEAETTIRAAYQRKHGAQLDSLPSTLVAEIEADRVICAASLRFAAEGFFSERYLDLPVEALVARHAGVRAARDTMAEVGSLAAARPGALGHLVAGVIEHLQTRGIRWAFFTATARLRNLLRRIGIPLIELGAADPHRIDNAEIWGGYYRHDPRVMLVGDDMLASGLGPRPNSTKMEPPCVTY